MIGTLSSLLDHLDAALHGPGRAMYVDAAHVRHIVETRDRADHYADLDEFGRRYVRQLQRRIRRGVAPEFTLLESRPQLLYYRDAMKKKETA